jgi:hypothetical protein
MKTFNSSDFEQKPLNRSKAYILLRDEAGRLPFPTTSLCKQITKAKELRRQKKAREGRINFTTVESVFFSFLPATNQNN